MESNSKIIGIITPFFCHDGKGNFLFYKRTKNSTDEHGRWDCSGGTLKFGEQPTDCLIRKIRQQYKINPEEYKELPACSIILKINGKIKQWVAIPFIVKVDRKKVKIGEPKKMEKITWSTLNNLPSPMHRGATYILKKHKNLFKKNS